MSVDEVLGILAAQIASDIWDRPSIETREELKEAVLQALRFGVAEDRKALKEFIEPRGINDGRVGLYLPYEEVLAWAENDLDRLNAESNPGRVR